MFSLFKNTLYVRISPQRLAMLHVESGKELADVPALALEQEGGKQRVVAVGSDAELQKGRSGITVANGFLHPRTPIADFILAEQTLKGFMRKLLPASLFAPSPVIVIHPLGRYDGGLTQIEVRALAELALGAGARKAYVWEGAELSREDLRDLRFPEVGGKLLLP